MKIWITGICGETGSKLARMLADTGHKVDGNDTRRIGAKNSLKGIPYCYTDCHSTEPLKFFMERFKPDIVVHCAPVGEDGAISVFRAAIASGVVTFIMAHGQQPQQIMKRIL